MTVPTTHPTLAVAVVLRVEYDEAVRPHTMRLDLVREGAPVGPPIGGTFGPIGHAPGMKVGAAAMVPLTFTANLLAIETLGLYEWMFFVDDSLLASIPMEVDAVPIAGLQPPIGSR